MSEHKLRYKVGDVVVIVGDVLMSHMQGIGTEHVVENVMKESRLGQNNRDYQEYYLNSGVWVSERDIKVKGKDEMYELREAYKIMQLASGIEVGDKVRVLREAESHEMGWGDTWVSAMGDSVGSVRRVRGVSPGEGVDLEGLLYSYPFFVLEIVEKAKTTKTITIDGKDMEISRESFEELKSSLAGDE